MSKKQKVILECRDCGNQFDAEIWTEINLEDQDLDHKLFTDQINIFECGECGNIGFVCYPINIKDNRASERAILIPLNKVISMDDYDEEVTDGFDPAFLVVEVVKKKPEKIFYNVTELKFEIYRWTGNPYIPYEGPPCDADIEEGLNKAILNPKEAKKLGSADWDSIDEKLMEGVLEKGKMVELDEEEWEILNLYFRFKLELGRSRKVINLRRGKD